MFGYPYNVDQMSPSVEGNSVCDQTSLCERQHISPIVLRNLEGCHSSCILQQNIFIFKGDGTGDSTKISIFMCEDHAEPSIKICKIVI